MHHSPRAARVRGDMRRYLFVAEREPEGEYAGVAPSVFVKYASAAGV